jgi:hypothetical protein
VRTQNAVLCVYLFTPLIPSKPPPANRLRQTASGKPPPANRTMHCDACDAETPVYADGNDAWVCRGCLPSPEEILAPRLVKTSLFTHWATHLPVDICNLVADCAGLWCPGAGEREGHYHLESEPFAALRAAGGGCCKDCRREVAYVFWESLEGEDEPIQHLLMDIDTNTDFHLYRYFCDSEFGKEVFDLAKGVVMKYRADYPEDDSVLPLAKFFSEDRNIVE